MEQSNEKKQIDKVNISPVKVKKETEFGKFVRKVFSDDVSKIGTHLVDEVVVPSIKKLMTESGKTVLDWIFYGISGSKQSSSTIGHVSYAKYYDSSKPPVEPSSYRANVYTVNDIIYNERGEAEEVLMKLKECIERYGMVSVGDYYDMISQKFTYTDQKYGWRDISSAEIIRVRDGYKIQFPKVQAL